jgi:hypothetical protein
MENGALEELLGEFVQGETEICVVKATVNDSGYDLLVGYYDGKLIEQQLFLGGESSITLQLKSTTSFERSYRRNQKVTVLGQRIEYERKAPLVVSKGSVGVEAIHIDQIIVGREAISEYLGQLDSDLEPFANELKPAAD